MNRTWKEIYSLRTYNSPWQCIATSVWVAVCGGGYVVVGVVVDRLCGLATLRGSFCPVILHSILSQLTARNTPPAALVASTTPSSSRTVDR